MANTTGQLSTFYNKEINTEVIEFGDGVQTVFNFALIKSPIFVNSFEIEYTIGSVVYTGITDSAGNITGTMISSGSVIEDGTGDITFSTAPDDVTNLEADYKTKGFLEKLLEFVVAPDYTQVIGTGDGAAKIFDFTLTNIPIAGGQAQLQFKIGSYSYTRYDNGAGEWEHDLISASSLDYSTGVGSITFVDAPDDTSLLNIWHVKSSTDGQDWKLTYKHQSRNNSKTPILTSYELNECYIKNSGNSGQESIYCGFREFLNESSLFYGVQIQVQDNEIADGDHWNHTYWDYTGSHEKWEDIPHINFQDDSMTYWLFSDKNRIMGVVKVSATIYETFYIGQGFRFSSPSKYQNPLCAIANAYQNYTSASVHDIRQYIINPNSNNVIIQNPAKEWKKGDIIYFTPRKDYLSQGLLTKTTNDEIVLFPVYTTERDTKETYFKLDGVYMIHCDNLQSEDTITVGTITYLIVQNVYRTSSTDYMAVRMD